MERARDIHKIQIEKDVASRWLFFVILTIPHINPGYLNQIPFAEMLIDGWRLASFAIIFVLAILKKGQLSLAAILIFLQQLYILLITVVHGGDIYGCMTVVFSTVSVVLLYTVGLNASDRDMFISAQLFCFECAVYMNLVTVFLYPDTMYIEHNSLFVSTKNWFLGYYNNYSQYFIPALMFAWLHKAVSGKIFRAYLLTVAIFVTAVLTWSGGVLVCLFGMAIMYLILKDYTGIFNGYSCWSIHILFWAFISIIATQRWIRWLIGEVLGKWNSFLLRLSMWKRAGELIGEAPILGHGIKDSISREVEVGFRWAMHAHNMVLEILYQGGLVNLLLWVLIIIVSGNIIWKKESLWRVRLLLWHGEAGV